MASQLESLVLDILLRDRASDGLGRISRASESAAGSTDTLNRKLEETGKKTARARVELAGDKEAQASLDRIDVKLLSLDRRTANPNLKVEGAARAIAEISAVDLELDRLGGKGGTAERATASLGSGAGGLAGPGGMAALIGAGAALSPVIATLGLGLAGFGVAAAGVAMPIEKAAKASGGLAANMHKLDPEQQAVARSILGLGAQYDVFQKALKPEVLSAFGGTLKIASDLLRDIQPVAVATGKAFDIFLSRVDAEFQSGTWQQFFGWMAQTAAPDMKLVGDAFITLMNAVPPLLEALQPVAVMLLTLVTDATRVIGDIGTLVNYVNAHQPSDSGWHRIGDAIGHLEKIIPAGHKSLLDLVDGGNKATTAAAGAAGAIKLSGDAAHTAAPKVQSLAQQVNSLTAAYSAALSPMLAYTGAEITQANDADALRKALKTSHDQIGLGTAAQRASFSAANTYIQDLLNTASAAGKSGKGIDTQIASIKGALPLLRNVRGGTRDYWAEVRELVGWLDRLRAEKLISERISVSGTGQWAMVQGGGKLTAGGAARGAYITAGTSPTADDVLVRASRGELIVPASLVSAGLADHLRGMIPGFAAGGIIPSYSGAFKGLQPWGQHNMTATIAAITAGIAGEMTRQLTAGAGGGGNVARWAPLILTALAMLRQDSSNLGAVEHRIAQESGGNPRAINLTDINAQRGDPSRGLMQTIMATFQRYRSFALPNDIYNPLANIFAGLNYAVNAYPGRSLSSVMLQAGGYDSGGYLPPGLSLAYNGTGRPERVGGGTTYVINVAVSPLARPADTGREVVAAIREHEKRAGRGWRTP